MLYIVYIYIYILSNVGFKNYNSFILLISEQEIKEAESHNSSGINSRQAG